MHGKIEEYTVREDVVSRFVDKFIKKGFKFFDEDMGGRNLLWCFFREESEKVLPTEDISKIKLPSDNLVYFYSERTEELYKTTFSEICEFINSLEPWEEIDAEIFNETMDWVIAITHEDFSMIIGLEDYTNGGAGE